jgi:hypothetical protein
LQSLLAVFEWFQNAEKVLKGSLFVGHKVFNDGASVYFIKEGTEWALAVDF